MLQIVLTTLVCLAMVAPSLAQMFAEIPDGKVMSYRITDPSTNEQLSEYRVSSGTDGESGFYGARIILRTDIID